MFSSWSFMAYSRKKFEIWPVFQSPKQSLYWEIAVSTSFWASELWGPEEEDYIKEESTDTYDIHLHTDWAFFLHEYKSISLIKIIGSLSFVLFRKLWHRLLWLAELVQAGKLVANRGVVRESKTWAWWRQGVQFNWPQNSLETTQSGRKTMRGNNLIDVTIAFESWFHRRFFSFLGPLSFSLISRQDPRSLRARRWPALQPITLQKLFLTNISCGPGLGGVRAETLIWVIMKDVPDKADHPKISQIQRFLHILKQIHDKVWDNKSIVS